MHRSGTRVLVTFASVLTIIVGLLNCSSSHPPPATEVGSDNNNGRVNRACYQMPLEGGCNMPIGPVDLPHNTPLVSSMLPAPEGGGVGACLGCSVGCSYCLSFASITYTCVEEGTFTITDTICDLEGGAPDASPDSSDAAPA